MCEEGNFGRTAARESLVASALRKRIAALEADLGVPLSMRRRRGDACWSGFVGPCSQRACRARPHAFRAQRAWTGGAGKRARHGQSFGPGGATCPDELAAYVDLHPRICIGPDECTSPDIVRAVREGTADLGVLLDLIAELSGLQVLPRRRDRLVVVMAPDHARARRPKLRSTSALADR